MTFGGGDEGMWGKIGRLQQDEAERIVGAALDGGINFIDTADVYAGGRSEEITGRALRNLKVPRESVVVATKAFGETGSGANMRGATRSHIVAALKESLRRLQLDHVDLYQIHGFDPATPIEETVRALDDVVRLGKARYVGFSNLPAWVASKALTFAAANGLARFQSAQVYYSIAGRDIEREIAPMCQAERVAILPWRGGALEVATPAAEKGHRMPYVKKTDRPQLDEVGEPRSPGDLNYVITRQIDAYLAHKGVNYAHLNEVIGVLECAKLELYRRIVARYEDKKMSDPENGDVYTVTP